MSDASRHTPVFLKASGLTKRFGAVQALKGVSLEFRSGEVLALIGENGAGKSTLMRLLEGEHQPDAGTIAVDGQPIRLTSPRVAHAVGIRIIHQEPDVIPELTVAENVFIGDFRARGGLFLDQTDLIRRTEAMLEEFGLASVLAPAQPCRNLGPAQRQLIEIMRAIRPGLRLAAFDEPTSSLTDEEASRLFTIIRKLRADGVAVVYISHRLPEISLIADRVAVLRDGELVKVDHASGFDEEAMVRLMVGRPVSDLFSPVKAVPGPVRFSVERLSSQHIKEVSFEVRAGEILGIGGLVGAGRSELARAIVGLDASTGGSIRVGGKSVRVRTPADAIRAGIGLVPEDRKQEALLLIQSVRENATMVISDKVSRFGIYRPGTERRIARSLVERLRVKTPSVEQPVGKLSGGNQQKVVFARWLAREPRVLILDEPTRGIDIGAKAEIYRMVEGLARDGMAIILISSEMPELLGLSHRILVMSGGRVTGELAQPATEHDVLALAMRHNRSEP